MVRHTAGELLQRLFADRAEGMIGEDVFLHRKADILRRSRCRLTAPIQSAPERYARAAAATVKTRWRLLVIALTRRVV